MRSKNDEDFTRLLFEKRYGYLETKSIGPFRFCFPMFTVPERIKTVVRARYRMNDTKTYGPISPIDV